MRIVVCSNIPEQAQRLCAWIAQRCRLRGVPASVELVSSLDVFWKQYAPDRFECLYLDLGDAAGFAAARRLREVNRECAIVLVGDTNRFSIQSLRIHVTDFFLRPLDRTRVERSVDRVLGR